MDDPSSHAARVLLRLSGEISTKARMTRRAFVSRLVRNLGDALASEGEPGAIERRYDRIYAETSRPASAEALARVFGVQALACAKRVPGEKLQEVVEAGAAHFAALVEGRRFAVRARVVGERSRRPFRARDLEVALGARLLPQAAGVDLGHPEVTAGVEVYRGHAYLFDEERLGPAGLPLGTQGRALSLVSGGFDSPVASWQMLRRGVSLDYVFCNLGGAIHRLGTLRVMKVLADHWSYGTRPRFHSLDFEAVTRELQERTEPRYWQVLLKRLMLRAAELLAREVRAPAVVTGECLGQVSSQTLQNLAVIDDATPLPVLRPLLGMNKSQIIEQAGLVGTAALSAVVDEYCALVPRHPATAARLEVVREQEARMDPEPLRRAVTERETLDLRSWNADESALPEIEVDQVPEGATLIDLRSRAEYQSWHPEGALQLDFGRALEAFPSFSRDQTYVLTCEFGLKSAHLAERMQREGFRAFHLRGGTRALRRRQAS